jgi:hypothetical protein
VPTPPQVVPPFPASLDREEQVRRRWVFLQGLQVQGPFKIPKGAANNYVLTSDAYGVGTWQSAASLSVGALADYWYKPGIAGTFTAFMGTGSGQSGTISSTAHATGGTVFVRGRTTQTVPIFSVRRVSGVTPGVNFGPNTNDVFYISNSEETYNLRFDCTPAASSLTLLTGDSTHPCSIGIGTPGSDVATWSSGDSSGGTLPGFIMRGSVANPRLAGDPQLRLASLTAPSTYSYGINIGANGAGTVSINPEGNVAASAVQLTVYGSTSQTANISEVRSVSGTTLYVAVDAAGRLLVNTTDSTGKLNVAPAAGGIALASTYTETAQTANANGIWQLSPTLSSSGTVGNQTMLRIAPTVGNLGGFQSFKGLSIAPTVTPSANSSSSQFIEVAGTVAGTFNVNTVRGLNSQINFNTSGTGTLVEGALFTVVGASHGNITALNALNFSVTTSGTATTIHGVKTAFTIAGNVTTLNGIGHSAFTVNSGTVTTLNEIALIDPTGAGAVTTLVGISIPNLTKGGTNWSLDIGSAASRHVGNIFVGGTTTPTAYMHLAAGTTAASTGPLKFTTGTSMTTAELGAVEFTDPDLFVSITDTTVKRKSFVLDDGTRLTSGKIPIAFTNGRLKDLTASSAYTPTNVTTDRSYDANSTTTDELADVLGTVIADLQAVGILG